MQTSKYVLSTPTEQKEYTGTENQSNASGVVRWQHENPVSLIISKTVGLKEKEC